MLRSYVCGIISPLWGIAVAFLLLQATAYAQPSWSWAKRAGIGGDQRGLAIVADAAGNTYSTGYIRAANNNFDANLISSSGAKDGFLAKYDVNGNNIWAFNMGGPNDDEGHAIAIDNAGNIYVTGFFRSNITFTGSPNITLNGSGNDHAFVAKFNSSGNVLWARQGVSNDAEGHGITTDGVNVYITGEFSNSIQFSPLSSISSAGNEDVFIASFNASTGSPNWCISGGGAGRDIGHSIAMDANGLYVTGLFNNTVSFQNMFGSMSTMGGNDVFLVKYNLNGTGIWKKRAGSSGSDEARSVTVKNTGVYVGGFFSASFGIYDNASLVQTQGHVSASDAFVMRCNTTTGNFDWIQSEGGSNDDETYAITVNPRGDVITTGMFKGTLPFGSQPSVTAGDEDMFVTSYDSTGTFLYGVVAGGSNKERGLGVSAPANSVVFFTGYFMSSPAVFGAHTVSTNGNEDIFFAELGCIVTEAVAGANQQICSSSATLSGNTPVIGTGLWTLLSGTGTITSPSSPTSGVTAMSPGSNVFVWTITNQTCISRDTLTILVDANPTQPNAGTDQQVCSSTASLAGNTVVIGTGSWSVSVGGATVTSPSNPTSPVSNLSVGVNEFIWTTTNQTCPARRDTVRITRDQVPTTSVTAADQTLCSSTASLSANTPVVGTGLWTLVTGTGTITNSSSASTTVNGLTPGTNVFQWTITNGVCPSSSDQITITVDANPTVAAAGSDQTICSSSATFTGNTPATGSGMWTLVSGTGIIANAASPASAVSGLSAGQNIFQWTISNGVCPSSQDTVIITVDDNPTVAAAGGDQTICSSGATLAGNTAVVGSGMWTLVSGTGTIANPASPASGVSGLSVGQNIFEWTISNGVCPSSSDQVTINVDANPTVAAAGSDQTICSSSATFSGNTPTTGTGLWTLISGTGTIANTTSSASGVSGLSAGQNIFEWTISNGVCPSSQDTVIITVDDNPTVAAAGGDQTICSSGATLAGNTAVVGSGMWTLVSGTGTITNPASPASGVSGLSIGQNIFEWTISNGVCPSSSDQVTINVDANPTTAAAGADQTICSPNGTITGNTPLIGNGIWSLISGTGTITSASNASTSVTGMNTGANVFEWRISNGTCPSSADTVIINIDAAPTIANAGPDVTHCSTTDVFAGNPAVVGTGLWTLISGTGTIANPASPTASVSGLSVGQNIFEWTISNGVCPSSGDQVIITVDADPTPAAAGADQTICSSSTTLSGNVPAIGTGVWAVISGNAGVTNPSSPSSGVTGMSSSTHVLTWTISNGTCPSSIDTMNIQVDASPTVANAGADNTLCSSTDVLTGNPAITGTGQWSLVSGTGSIANSSSPSTGVSGLSVGQNAFQWTITNGVCPASHDTVIITVDDFPTVAVAGTDQTLCSPNATITGNSPVVGTGSWSTILGNGVIATPLSASSAVTGISTPVNLYEWRISNGTCPSSADTVLILLDAVPTTASAGNDNTLCSSSDVLNGNTALIGTGQWTLVSGSGIISNPNAASTSVSGLAVGQNIFEWTISNGVCPSSSDQVIITVDPMPTTAIAANDVQTCSSSDVVNGNAPLVGNGIWTLITGGAAIVSPTNPSSAVNNLSPGMNYFEWSITSGTCPVSRDTMAIEYNQAPSGAVAGSDIIVCSYDVVMQAQTPIVGTGVWTTLPGSFLITDSANPSAFLSNVPAGVHYYTWTTQNGFCTSTPDTVMVQIFSPPSQAVAGDDQLIHILTAELNATPADTGTGTWTVIQGAGVFENPNDPHTRVNNLAVGTNVFRWTTSNGVCNTTDDEVQIDVHTLIVPSGYSPNGDGVNDRFEIIGLEEYASATLEVFNRWGGVVYTSGHYDNSWNGNGDNGQQLPDDIYYYVLKVDQEVFTGFVAIKRSVQ